MQNADHTYIAETPREARAAAPGRYFGYALMFGALGAFGVFAIVYLYFA